VSVQIRESFEIAAPVDAVWEILRDPRMVAECFPGAELSEQVDDDSYTGTIVVLFGPTKATFSGRAKIVVVDAERRGTIEASGRDKRGASGATAKVTVDVAGDQQKASVAIVGTIDVAGPLAGFANTGGAYVTRALLSDFASAVEVRAESATAGREPPTRATPLSVFAVLRRMISDMARAAIRRLRRLR
jgi:carbon monoxide dehydrogenase subunit G